MENKWTYVQIIILLHSFSFFHINSGFLRALAVHSSKVMRYKTTKVKQNEKVYLPNKSHSTSQLKSLNERSLKRNSTAVTCSSQILHINYMTYRSVIEPGNAMNIIVISSIPLLCILYPQYLWYFPKQFQHLPKFSARKKQKQQNKIEVCREIKCMANKLTR